MSPPGIDCSATVAPPTSGPCVRVTATLVMRNHSGRTLYVPDPLRGTRVLALHLRSPAGQASTHVLGDLPPKPGVRLLPINRAIPMSGEEKFEVELTRYFEVSVAGRYSLVLEYRFDADDVWRSPVLEFERLAPAGTYLTVMAAEAAGYGYHAVLWQEQPSTQIQTVLFEENGQRFIEDASIISADLAAEVAMSQYPAASPFAAYWLASIMGRELGVRFFAHGDPSLTLTERRLSLSKVSGMVRLVHPLLADSAPYEGRPCLTLGMLHGENAPALTVLRLTPEADIAASASVDLPGQPVGAWAIAPRADERYFLVALMLGEELRLVAFPSDSQDLLGALRVWYSASQVRFLAGDVRADLEGQIFVGLVLQAGTECFRLTFQAPRMSGAGAALVERTPVLLPTTMGLCGRLDTAGRLHLLYLGSAAPAAPADQASARLRLWYVAASDTLASWSSQRVGGLQPWSVQLILRDNARPVAVAYDIDSGPFLEKI
jgi:hypothetical protein